MNTSTVTNLTNYLAINTNLSSAYAYAMREQLLALYLLIPLGLLALIPNLFIVITIVRSKLLHNKGQYVILSQAVAECIYLIVNIPMGAKQYLSLIGYFRAPISATFLQCAAGLMLASLGGTASFYLSVWLAVDRLLAIFRPVFYRNASVVKHVAFVNALTWTCAVFTYTLGLIGMDTNRVFPLCDESAPLYNRAAQIWFANGTLILTPVMAFCYITASVLLFVRYKKANLVGETQKAEWRKLFQMNVFIALASIGAIFVTTLILRSICRTMAFTLATQGHYDVSTFLRLLAYSTTYIEKMLHFFLHMRFNTDFRKSFLKIFGRKQKNAVTAVGVAVAS